MSRTPLATQGLSLLWERLSFLKTYGSSPYFEQQLHHASKFQLPKRFLQIFPLSLQSFG